MGWLKCLKKKYDKRGAQTALNNINANLKRYKARKEIRYYHCPLCNAWHLTSTEDRPGIGGTAFKITINEDWFKKFILTEN